MAFRIRKNKKGKLKISKVLSEFKKGILRSSSGKKVKDKKQATAIAMSEARRRAGKSSDVGRKIGSFGRRRKKALKEALSAK